MPLTFQLKVSDYVAPGAEPVAIVVQEKDKAGTVLGRYLVTMWLPAGVLDVVSSGQGYMHEVKISENVYQFLKGAGFRTVEYQPPLTLTVWDFVPDYKRIMAKLTIGDLAVLPAFFELQGKIIAAGLTVGQVAAAAVSGGK